MNKQIFVFIILLFFLTACTQAQPQTGGNADYWPLVEVWEREV